MCMRILAATAMLAAASTVPAISQEAGAAPDVTVAGPDQAAERPIGAATFLDADGATIGSANLRDTPHGVVIRITIKGLEPGEKAVHIHENGECDPAGGFESAGGHFNPSGARHGYLAPEGPHAGDLPNQWVTEDGVLEATVLSPMTALVTGEQENPGEGRFVIASSTENTAIVVHEGADDYASDPAGHAGGRIACGVIELAPPFGG